MYLSGSIFKIQGIHLNGTAPGVGGLGINGFRDIAFAKILHDPVGIPDSGIQTCGQILGGDLVGTVALNDGHQFLNRHG